MTPAVKALERAKVTHRVITYDHDPTSASYGEEAASAMGVSPEVVFKTLVAATSGGGPSHVVGVVSVAAKLDLKALASAVGAKKATMADTGDAERLTGYVVGGISPVGQRKRLPIVIDDSARHYELIRVSGGKRGLEIEVAPADLATAIGASFAPIATN